MPKGGWHLLYVAPLLSILPFFLCFFLSWPCPALPLHIYFGCPWLCSLCRFFDDKTARSDPACEQISPLMDPTRIELFTLINHTNSQNFILNSLKPCFVFGRTTAGGSDDCCNLHLRQVRPPWSFDPCFGGSDQPCIT